MIASIYGVICDEVFFGLPSHHDECRGDPRLTDFVSYAFDFFATYDSETRFQKKMKRRIFS